MQFRVFNVVDEVCSKRGQTTKIMANNLWFIELPMANQGLKQVALSSF